MREKKIFKKNILLIILIGITQFGVTKAQSNKPELKMHYELIINTADKTRVDVEVTVIRNAVKSTNSYRTPIRIKYKSGDMVIEIKTKNRTTKTMQFKLACVDAKLGEMYNISRTASNAKFEVVNNTFMYKDLE